MWYMPYLRVRHAVLVYASFALGITLLAITLRLWPGSVMIDGHKQVLVRVDISMLLAGATAFVGGLATVLGLNLAAENEGHLEVAWTKPISREGYALGVFAVDIAAMIACIVFTAVCGALVVIVYLGYNAIGLGPGDSFLSVLAYCGWPLCVYAWITALSASLRRNRGTIAGLFWPLMIGLAALAFVPIPAVHSVAAALNLINPLELYSINNSGPQSTLGMHLWGWAVAALLLVAALVQWRRLET